MAATSADTDYLDRMLRLHPWRDASAIIAARASYLAARRAEGSAATSAVDTPSIVEPCAATELRILPDRWHEQAHEVQVPLRARGHNEGTVFAMLTTRMPWWLWWIGLALLANVVRSVVTSRP
jgi:hypothetical protein